MRLACVSPSSGCTATRASRPAPIEPIVSSPTWTLAEVTRWIREIMWRDAEIGVRDTPKHKRSTDDGIGVLYTFAHASGHLPDLSLPAPAGLAAAAGTSSLRRRSRHAGVVAGRPHGAPHHREPAHRAAVAALRRPRATAARSDGRGWQVDQRDRQGLGQRCRARAGAGARGAR